MMDAIVLGCGISGMTSAKELSGAGLSVAIIDDYPEAGGNHISHNFGPFTFDIGTIFFWPETSFTEVFPECSSRFVALPYHVERVKPSGEIAKHPFDPKAELFARSPLYLAQIAGEIAAQRIVGRRTESAEGYARYYLGDRLLQDSGLGYFMQRFYGLPLDEISYDLARQRMGWIEQKGSLRRTFVRARNRRRQAKLPLTSSPFRQVYARPQEGFATMYRPAVAALEQAGVTVCLDAGLRRVWREGGMFVVESRSGVVRAPRLLSSIPIAKLMCLLGSPRPETPPSIPLRTLFFRFRGRRGFSGVVLYNFHRAGFWKRLTMHSDYYGLREDWQYFSVEVPVTPECASAESAVADFRGATSIARLFDGELVFVGEVLTDFAYPLYNRDSATLRNVALKYLKAMNIEAVGRQGSFEYIPAADGAVDRVRQHLLTCG